TSQVPRRSILCLCPALRPRPNRRSLASLTVSSMLPPRFPRQELQRLMNFGALSRGFGTCCLRFKTGVATTPARLASGWLARLYREGVEPSGSLQKVSDRSLILLFWIYPGAREVSSRLLRRPFIDARHVRARPRTHGATRHPLREDGRGDRAHGDGDGDRAARPRCDLFDELLRALPCGSPVRHARSDDRRACGLERGHVAQRWRSSG